MAEQQQEQPQLGMWLTPPVPNPQPPMTQEQNPPAQQQFQQENNVPDQSQPQQNPNVQQFGEAQPNDQTWYNPHTGRYEPIPQQIPPTPAQWQQTAQGGTAGIEYQQPAQQQQIQPQPVQVQPQQQWQTPPAQQWQPPQAGQGFPLQPGQQSIAPPAPGFPPSQGIPVAQQLEQMRQQQQQAQGAGVNLKPNLKGVEVGNFNLVPTELMYEGRISNPELKEKKDEKGAWMIRMTLIITSPNEYRGVMIPGHNINLTEPSFPFFRALLEATNLFDFQNEESMLEDVSQLKDRIVRFSVKHEPYEGQMRNKVNGSFSKPFESPEITGQMPQQNPFQQQVQSVQQQYQQPMYAPPAQQVQPVQQQPQQQQFVPPQGYTPPANQ